jgi:hypothetical protein
MSVHDRAKYLSLKIVPEERRKILESFVPGDLVTKSTAAENAVLVARANMRAARERFESWSAEVAAATEWLRQAHATLAEVNHEVEMAIFKFPDLSGWKPTL